MNRVVKVLCLVCLVGFMSFSAFGWGNATHVYFANHLGAKFGAMNAAEMYGVLLPDIFGLQFDPIYQALDHQMHYDYEAALRVAHDWRTKAEAYAIASHNEVWGADWTAHIKGIPEGSFPDGYVIDQAMLLAQEVYPYLVTIFPADGKPLPVPLDELAVLLSHDVIESAVDILVKRNIDPDVGTRIVTAAQMRPGETGQFLAAAYGDVLIAYGVPRGEIVPTFVAAERSYRQNMIAYGQLYCLPESDLISTLSVITTQLGVGVIQAVEGVTVEIDPAAVATFLNHAITQVEPTYLAELSATLDLVKENLVAHHIYPQYPMFAEGEGGPNSEALTAEVPKEFSLEQNYPNPFNPSTTISFALPKDSHMTLKIYNAIGQEVATLVDGMESAGVHSATWNASNLASGVYFSRMTAGDFTSVRRLMLVK